MSYRATTVRNVSFPTGSTIQFDQAVGDAVLTIGYATLYPQSALYSAVSKSKTGVDILITSVVGSTVSGNITNNPSGRTIAANDICEMFSLSTTLVLGAVAPFAYAPDYNWTPQSPGGSLTSGVAPTITLSPVPLGLNGTDTNHYVYISGGSGGPEALLITGGSAVAGAAIGTIILAAPANNHSGAWTIRSASSGIHEAMLARPYTGVVLGPLVTPLYHSLSIPVSSPSLEGQGSQISVLTADGFTNTSILILPTGSFRLANLGITPLANMTAGAAVFSSNNGYLEIESVQFGSAGGTAGVYIGVHVNGGTLSIHGITLMVVNYRGVEGSAFFPAIDDLQVVGNRTGGAVPPVGSCGIYMTTTAGGYIQNYLQANGALEYGLYIDTAPGYCNEIGVNNFYADCYTVAGIIVAGAGPAAHWELSNFRLNDTNGAFNGASTAIGLRLSTGCLNWQVSNGNIGFDSLGMLIIGGSELSFSNVMCFPVTAIGAGGTGLSLTDGTHITFVGCYWGDSVSIALAGNGFVVTAGTTTYLTIVGCAFIATNQPQKLGLTGTLVNPRIANNNGIGNFAKTVVAGGALAFPVMDDNDVLTISGATAVNSVTGLREGQNGVLIFTNAGPGAWTAGASIGNTFTPAQNVPVKFAFTGGKIYLSS